MTSSSTPRHELASGIRAELPITLGVIPFGMIYGVLALSAGLPPPLAQATSAIVFAGSAQFIGVQLIGAGAPALVLLSTTFIVNLRHLLYSASMAPHLRHLSPLWRWLLAYLLTDEAFAVTILHYNEEVAGNAHHKAAVPTHNKHYYLLGAGLTLWSVWQASTAVGIFLGAQVPASWSLDFTLALTFIGLVVPILVNRANLGAALSAGMTAVVLAGLPFKLNLMAAALSGIIVGLWIDGRTKGQDKAE